MYILKDEKHLSGLAPYQNHPEMALDSKPYTTLLYANGPGYKYEKLAGNSQGCPHDRPWVNKRQAAGFSQY